MYTFRNRLTANIVWCSVIFILTFVLYANADDSTGETISLFKPVTHNASPQAISDSQQDVIIDLVPLKAKKSAYAKIRFDFLGRSVIAKRIKSLSGVRGSVTWIGKPEGDDGTIVLSVSGDALFGRIEIRDEVYQIEPVRETDTHRIFKIDPYNAAPIDEGGLIPPYDALPDGKNKYPAASKGADNGSVFDILILYTSGFAEAYPGDELIAKISYLAGIANASYTNSEIDLTARVVGVKRITYKDTGSLNDALDDLANGNGVFSKVTSLRNRFGADLVVLMRVFGSDNDACGLAWQMTSLSSTFEKWAYSVIQVGSIGNSYCSDQTLAHEMGHNMGCAHEDGGKGALYRYSKGYCFYPYKSVMAYCTNSETRVSHFSNPDISYAGIATGTDDANNALSIKKVKLTVSQFRDSKCLGSIEVSENKTLLNREESTQITVTVTGEYDLPAEDEKVAAKTNPAGKKLITISPSDNTTNSAGQVAFTITAGGKKGRAKITFKSGCLKKSITVRIR